MPTPGVRAMALATVVLCVQVTPALGGAEVSMREIAVQASTTTTTITSTSSSVTQPAPVNPNCSVRHCLQCDPSLKDQCMECKPPMLRELGECRDTCTAGYFPVHNRTDNPPDYPHCALDCESFAVTGIPSGPEPWPAASSA